MPDNSDTWGSVSQRVPDALKPEPLEDPAALCPQRFHERMNHHGVALYQFSDSIDLVQLVHRIGQPTAHNTRASLLWDITPLASTGFQARSHGRAEFHFHSDASFEDPQPGCIAMYTLRQDRKGGGQSLLINNESLLPDLSEKCRQILRRDFPFQVPPEFHKGRSTNWRPILFGHSSLAYRRDIIIDSLCSGEQRSALGELERALELAPRHCATLPEQSVLFLDNNRYLHGRRRILDDRRHLQRVRFCPRSAAISIA